MRGVKVDDGRTVYAETWLPAGASRAPVALLSVEWRGVHYHVFRVVSGQIAVDEIGADGSRRAAFFQRISARPTQGFDIAVAVNSVKFAIFVGGKTLFRDPFGNMPTVQVAIRPPRPRDAGDQLLPSNWRGISVPSFEGSFFLKTMWDLLDRMATGDWYDALRAAGLLRQLLIDSPTLIDVANVPHRLPIQYYFAAKSAEPLTADSLEARFFSIDPQGVEMAEGRLQALLASNVMWLNGRSVTVRDLIRALSNARGGVHLGKPTRDSEEDVLTLDRLFGLGQPAVVTTQAVEAIGRVVIRAVKPLMAAILAPYLPEPATNAEQP